MVLVDKLNEFFKEEGLVNVKQDFIELNEDVLSYTELFFHLDNPNSISGSSLRVVNVGDISFSIQGSKESISSIYRIIDKRINTLNFRDIYNSLGVLLGDMNKFLFTFNSGEYHDLFLGSKISYVNIYANGFLLVKCKYLQTLNDEHVENIPFIVEYNLRNIHYVLGDSNNDIASYSVDSLRDSELSRYVSIDNNIENEDLLFNSHFNESEIHYRDKRYVLAYISLIKANKDVQFIKAKTGIFSEKYISNMTKIRELNFDIRKAYLSSKD